MESKPDAVVIAVPGHCLSSVSSGCSFVEPQRQDCELVEIALSCHSVGSSVSERWCRICMDTVHQADFDNDTAILLGCKCADGLDVVHVGCAKKWFRLKRSLCCEICGVAAENLPEGFKRKLQRRIDQVTRAQVAFQSDPEEEEAEAEEVVTDCSNVGTYGVLPATVVLLVFFLYFNGGLGIYFVPSLVLAALLSVLSLALFFAEGQRGPWHLVFVAIHLATVLLLTSATYTFYAWEPLTAAIAGALLGPVTAVGIFAFVRMGVLFACPMFHQWNSSILR